MPEDRFDVCVIGPVARDSNAVGTRELPPQPGGAAFYSTMVYLALGLRAAVVTRVAAADEAALLTELRAAGATVFNLPTRVSTSFRNLYDPADPDARRQRVDAIADPIRARDLPALRRAHLADRAAHPAGGRPRPDRALRAAGRAGRDGRAGLHPRGGGRRGPAGAASAPPRPAQGARRAQGRRRRDPGLYRRARDRRRRRQGPRRGRARDPGDLREPRLDRLRPGRADRDPRAAAPAPRRSDRLRRHLSGGLHGPPPDHRRSRRMRRLRRRGRLAQDRAGRPFRGSPAEIALRRAATGA